jgi:predicted transcriptional regulator
VVETIHSLQQKSAAIFASILGENVLSNMFVYLQLSESVWQRALLLLIRCNFIIRSKKARVVHPRISNERAEGE